jgi:hypothetical protein
MRATTATITASQTRISPLMLSDRLLRLAEDADTAGLRVTAEHLLALAEDVLDLPARLHS